MIMQVNVLTKPYVLFFAMQQNRKKHPLGMKKEVVALQWF